MSTDQPRRRRPPSTRAEPSPCEFSYDSSDDGLCPGDCRVHRQHVYTLCYGRPVRVRDRDYIPVDPAYDYPISHYVGYTTQRPIDRIRQHGARSAHYIVAIRPGTARDEENIKRSGTCARCGHSLWYYAESPSYSPSFADWFDQRGEILAQRGAASRVRLLELMRAKAARLAEQGEHDKLARVERLIKLLERHSAHGASGDTDGNEPTT